MPEHTEPDGHWIDYIPLDEVQPAENNPKEHDGPTIRRMISKLGLGELPLLDDRTGRLVAGHGRIEQLTELRDAGKDAPRGVRVLPDGSWAVPILRGWRSESDDHARAYLVGSNQSSTKGGWDEHALAEMLTDLDAIHMLDLTGFDEKDLAALEKTLTGPAPGSADLLDPPDDDQYRSQFGVIVECDSAASQEEVYETLRGQGYTCRVVTV